jgi:hypothetical protein
MDVFMESGNKARMCVYGIMARELQLHHEMLSVDHGNDIF